jgi:hypothetical protein
VKVAGVGEAACDAECDVVPPELVAGVDETDESLPVQEARRTVAARSHPQPMMLAIVAPGGSAPSPTSPAYCDAQRWKGQRSRHPPQQKRAHLLGDSHVDLAQE